MRSPLARWKVRHLVGSWLGYWAVLAAATLTPAAIAMWKVTRDGAKGNASVSLGDGGLHAQITGPGVATWDHTIALTTVVFAVVGPPLLLWVCWVLSASASGDSVEQHSMDQLPSGDDLPMRRADRKKDAIH